MSNIITTMKPKKWMILLVVSREARGFSGWQPLTWEYEADDLWYNEAKSFFRSEHRHHAGGPNGYQHEAQRHRRRHPGGVIYDWNNKYHHDVMLWKRNTSSLWWESISHLQRSGNAELWCFLYWYPKYIIEQTVKLSVISYARRGDVTALWIVTSPPHPMDKMAAISQMAFSNSLISTGSGNSPERDIPTA